jgi:hypothetical protein
MCHSAITASGAEVRNYFLPILLARAEEVIE